MASAKRSAPGDGSPSSRCLEIVLVSSMIAAIAVLKAKRPAMSLVTFSIAQCALRSSSRSDAESSSGTGWSGVLLGDVGAQAPQPCEEAVHALDARVRPVGILVGRADEHDVGPRGVGAVALDVALGRDDVAARLGHLRPFAGDHALREEPREGLLEVQVAQVGERLREEARVQQVQDRVLDAADVLVDGHPARQHLAGPTAPRRCGGRRSA